MRNCICLTVLVLCLTGCSDSKTSVDTAVPEVKPVAKSILVPRSVIVTDGLGTRTITVLEEIPANSEAMPAGAMPAPAKMPPAAIPRPKKMPAIKDT
jgi:hypothetical protein